MTRGPSSRREFHFGGSPWYKAMSSDKCAFATTVKYGGHSTPKASRAPHPCAFRPHCPRSAPQTDFLPLNYMGRRHLLLPGIGVGPPAAGRQLALLPAGHEGPRPHLHLSSGPSMCIWVVPFQGPEHFYTIFRGHILISLKYTSRTRVSSPGPGTGFESWEPPTFPKW